jgi:endonuclease/exonuclease/phosphatase (EEP) superfamily protein YafD
MTGNDGGAPSKPPRIRHRQWGGATLGLLLGIGGLVGGRLGHLYPHFDVFAQFGAQFIALAASFTVAVLLFSRFKALIGMALTLALLAGYGAWPHLVSATLQAGPFQLAPGEQVLRVGHFNTFKNNADYDTIAQEVLRLDADVMVLVEMSVAKKKVLLPLLKAVYPHIYDCEGGRFCDMAIVSKIPIVEAEGIGQWVGPPLVRVTLGGSFAGVHVFGIHTTRFPYSRAHLTQARELVRYMEGFPGDVIMAGDFNATPFSRVTTIIEQGASLMRLTELPTWPTHLEVPQLAIDHMFASSAFRVVGNQQIGNAAGSDHYPILLTLARKPKT